MFTSRAEYRILLRYSNAHKRLFTKSNEHELLDKKTQRNIAHVLEQLSEYEKLLDTAVEPEIINPILKRVNEKEVDMKKSVKNILKRPNISIEDIIELVDTKKIKKDQFTNEVLIETEAIVKYDGYIKRQQKHIDKIIKNETIKIPKRFNYKDIKSISNEGREKLNSIRPETLGQAMRISGITPADISILSVMLIK